MIGKKLKYLREVHSISQAELANSLHVSRQSISLYEIDKRDPDFEVLRKICNYFGVTADYFIFDEKPHSPPGLSDNEVEIVNAMRQPPNDEWPVVDENLSAVVQAVSHLSSEKLKRLAGYIDALKDLPDGSNADILEKRA